MAIKHGPWAPFEPTTDDPWDLAKVAHLHRRAGLAATWPELQRDLKAGPEASVRRLFEPRLLTDEEQQVLASLRRGVLDSGNVERLKAWWLYRLLDDPDGLREKLTLFWHGHFATSNSKVGSIPRMLRQNETLRRHALGDLTPLLNDVIADPAMLVWLDGIDSKKELPNENFAREFLELFTLGTGHYNEKDVREAARAFTGWVEIPNDRTDPAPGFRQDPKLCDPGVKNVLKQSGAWKPGDIVRITLEQPAAAEFLCRKLYRFLVSEAADPSPSLLKPLAEELRNQQYSIRSIIEIVLRSRHFYSRVVRRQRIKNPVEFSAGLVRALEVPRAEVNLLAMALTCERQGQDLFYPPTVKGWDGARTWLNSTTVLERGNWCNDVLWGNPDLGIKAYDPLAWAQRNRVSPDQAAQAFLDLLLQGDVDPRDRETILRTGAAGTVDALRKTLQLILHCPEYQLA
jgi:uncharacterized protein (DUF1800 family)